MKFGAVVVSKMDRPLGPVLDSILPHVEELVIVRGNAGVAERWDRALNLRLVAASKPGEAAVYVQDDDAIVDVPAVLEQYQANIVACNMPMDRRCEYPDGIALVGWGAVFDARLVDRAFRRYWAYAGSRGLTDKWHDDVFRSEADRIFTGLSELKLIDVPFEHLSCAHGRDRMGRRPNHGDMRRRVGNRIRAVRENENPYAGD